MAFAKKIDYLGLERTGLSLKANGQNASNSILQIPGADGSFIGDEITGHIKAPNSEYAVTGTVTLNDIKLGMVYGDKGPFAVSHIHITTGAGSEPVVTADGVQIEAEATRTLCVYPITEQTITPARHALTFGAFTYTESVALALQSSEYDATCDLSPTTINNEPVASDATAGVETVTATFWSSTEETEPNVTINENWHITSDWNCTGADGSMFEWTVTLTHYLTAEEA